jgi:CRISPR-associated protein Cas5t
MPTCECYVSVPVTSFRAPRAREYLETLPVPPPSTVYGMLCSTVGEVDRNRHVGAELAIAVLTPGVRSRVLRTLWRVKDVKTPAGTGENKRPDGQELLTGMSFAAFVRDGVEAEEPSLASRVVAALSDPGSVTRFGGLSLGESSFLVDELRLLQAGDLAPRSDAAWLVADPAGSLALPLWVDHVGSASTRYGQFDLSPLDTHEPPVDAWVRIGPKGW